MVGIYKFENGLKFTEIIAETVEKAEEYLGNKYGREMDKWTGARDENNRPIYEKAFVPGYNKETFKILPLTLI